MQLRPYQLAFVESVEKGWSEFRKLLGVAPTGSGKTIIFSHLAKRQFDRNGKKTLILCHREELIDQAIAKLHAATGIIADKEKAEWRASKQATVVVASVQTMIRRLDQWAPDHFALVVMDEAHHSLAGSFRTVLDHFTGSNILGVTATPDRGDKRNLGEFYESIAHEISLLDLINDGFLSPITIKSIPLEIDLNEVGSIAGDFDSGELGNVLEPYLGQIASAIKANAGQRKTLCFLPLISTSHKFVDACREAGLTADHIDGESPDRKEKLAAFARGDFQVLSNAMLLLEGYDCPAISCVVMLRPTRSRPLFAQAVGRGTRTSDGKENLLLLDFLWLHEKHRIVHPASLIAKSEGEAEEMTRLAEEKSEAIPGDVADQMPLDLIGLQSEVQSAREEALRKKLEALRDREARFITAEEFAVKHHALAVAEFEPTMKWHTDPLTLKQTEWIEKAGVNIDTVKGKGHASQILDVFFKSKDQEPASHKQKWVMRQQGWRSSDGIRGPDEATRKDAIGFFSSLNKQK